jgi:uncharacterized protein YdaU (DUF1376 family)
MSGLDGMMLWIGKYLAQTQHLTTTQIGGHSLLRMKMWIDGGSLPNDEKRLARIAKLPLDKWRKIAPEIMELFEIEGDRITDSELRQELQKTLSLIEKRRSAGRAGGQAKSLKRQDVALANAIVLAEQSHKQKDHFAAENKTQNKKERDSSRVADATPTVENDPFDSFWSAYPKRKGDNPKKLARQIFLRRLADGIDAEAMIAGAKRLAEQMAADNKIATEFVPMAKTWLGQNRWEDSEPSKPAPAVAMTMVFISENDPRHRVWERHLLATRGRGPAIVERDADHVRGSWFESESPPIAKAA